MTVLDGGGWVVWVWREWAGRGAGRYAPVDSRYGEGLRAMVTSMVSVDPAGRPTLQQATAPPCA